MKRNAPKPHVALVAAIAVAVLATGLLGFAGDNNVKEEQITLIGCLNADSPAELSRKEFTLIERESGDWISVKGPETLGEHIGHTVKLLGDWQYDDMDNRYFVAKKVTMVSDSCKE